MVVQNLEKNQQKQHLYPNFLQLNRYLFLKKFALGSQLGAFSIGKPLAAKNIHLIIKIFCLIQDFEHFLIHLIFLLILLTRIY